LAGADLDEPALAAIEQTVDEMASAARKKDVDANTALCSMPYEKASGAGSGWAGEASRASDGGDPQGWVCASFR
jgi:hypothetical protein